MTLKVLGLALLLASAGMIMGNRGLAAQAQNARADQIETVATFPSAGSTENISGGPDGTIYVTGMQDKVLWRVRPGGRVEQVASFPSLAAVLAVAPTPDGFVVTAWERRSTGAVLDLSDVGSQILVLDKAGKVTATLRGEKGHAFNGVTPSGNGLYLVADTNAATLWQVDPAKKRIERWLSDPMLGGTGQPPIGANGVKVHNGWVYVSVSSRNAIYRVQVDGNGRPKGSLSLFAEGFRPDDFDLTADGTLYSSSGDTMYQVSPNGTVSKFLEKVPNGAATMISKDGRWLYWPTRGGSAPQRLLRVAIK